MFDAASGHALDHLNITLSDPPQKHLGSAFDAGVYSQVDKDLRQVLGRPVTGVWSQTYCGHGDLAACRLALWQSLSSGAVSLQREFGSPAVASWQRKPGVAAMEWVHRPTFQQVGQIGR